MTMHSPGETARSASLCDPCPAFRIQRSLLNPAEPISIGVPFPCGLLPMLSGLELVDSSGLHVPSQWEALSEWPDGSVRWALLDFVAKAQGDGEAEFRITRASTLPLEASTIAVSESAGGIQIDTGACSFNLSRNTFKIEAENRDSGHRRAVTMGCVLTTVNGRAAEARIHNLKIAAAGPVRATVHAEGAFHVEDGPRVIELAARISFFSGTGLIKAELTLRNSQAARHPGGLWDLGDAGSLLFRELALRAEVKDGDVQRIAWTPEPSEPRQTCIPGRLSILQASSGGENWKSRGHVDRDGIVRLPFRGYRVSAPAGQTRGLRASPVVSLELPGWRLSTAIEKFWEQFPKSIEADGRALRMGLFPTMEGESKEQALYHELQGGEQKTHTAFLSLEPEPYRDGAQPLGWVHSPASVVMSPSYLASTGAMGRFAPASDHPHREYESLIQNVVEGPHSFFAKREVVDEFGWRHFGDVYADHENTYAKEPRPIISHYNNQYDVIHGLLVQFSRSGDARWLELGRDLARHVIDIDLYHTREDKPSYNGGLFWHTDHYTDAHRCTHRTYSKDSPQTRAGGSYGGGPSNEHNYSTGILLFHYMTGSPAARDAVLGLAELVHAMDDGTRTVLGALDPGPTGRASSTTTRTYHGPGRGAGNSIRTLLDAFELTGEAHHLKKVEELIRRCIHPLDDIASRNLENVEERWSYIVFLQVLGKYLDLKVAREQRDEMYAYARASLSAYAAWMLENEVPYMQVLDKVEFPTETWPAHDIRKSVVFDYAAVYGDPGLRERFREKAAFFFRECLAGVSTFETRACTRPLAILLQSGPAHEALSLAPPLPEPPLEKGADFGSPQVFVDQMERVKRMLKTPTGVARVCALAFRPASLLRIFKVMLDRRRT